MKAARCRNSGTGEWVNEWKRLSGVNLDGSFWALEKANASDSALELDVKSLVGLEGVDVERGCFVWQ
jgi:hypothetical protein